MGCNSEQGPTCSDMNILGTRCKENRVASWSLECAICKVVGVGSKVCRGRRTWSGRKHPVGRYRAASGVWSSKIASADWECRDSRLLRAGKRFVEEMGVRFRGGCTMSRSGALLLCHWEPCQRRRLDHRVYQLGPGIWQEDHQHKYESRILLANEHQQFSRVTSHRCD